MDRKSISIFGATGSIGQSTRDVILSARERFDVCTLTASRNVDVLGDMALELQAKRVVIADEALYGTLKDKLSGYDVEVAAGRQALVDAAEENIDLHVAAIVGMAGLEPLYNALEHAGAVAVANKEPLVAAGKLVISKAQRYDTKILPLDSEHNAIFQVLDESSKDSVKRLILTASGGPFLDWTIDDMNVATPAQAVSHPNWSMGAKISVDSATMMNKALEVIEAHHLFSMSPEKIEIIIHPQSVVHSMVEYADGSILAQMGASDMRTPITYALGWPERIQTPGEVLDLRKLAKLEFREPDRNKFPALGMAYDALRGGQATCIALNAANEIAVEAFLAGQISFGEIVATVQKVLTGVQKPEISGLESVVSFDKEVRAATRSVILPAKENKGKIAS